MKQRGVYVLGAVIAIVLAFSGCRKQQAHQVDQPQRAKLVQGAKLISVLNPQHADSLVLMAYKQGDYQRMLTLTDSLSARGELNELRTRGYRATAYRGMKDMKAAIASLRRAIEVEDVSDNDYFLMVHLKTLYAELQQLQGNSEGALRTALALIEQLRSDGYEDSEFCQRLYSVLGESQLNLDHPDEAAKYFERMYGILQKSIRNDSVGDHLLPTSSGIRQNCGWTVWTPSSRFVGARAMPPTIPLMWTGISPVSNCHAP